MKRDLLLSHVTLTGLDDKTDINRINRLSNQFPIVEWGILYSPKRESQGGRYPSIETIHKLLKLRLSWVKMSLHFCGDGVQRLLTRDHVETGLMNTLSEYGGRVQLNFNQRKEQINIRSLSELFDWYPNIEFITQYNDANENLWRQLTMYDNHSVLFDSSGGRGIEAIEYSTPLPYIHCGYAGGLGPDNLAFKLKHIESVTGSRRYWVDMENKLRDQNDIFDIGLAEECLKTV